MIRLHHLDTASAGVFIPDAAMVPPVKGLDRLRQRLKLWRIRELGEQPRVFGRILIRGTGRIVIGDRLLLDARECPIELHVMRGAELLIGDDVTIVGGTSIEATARVTIGSGVRVGAYCKVIDNNWHPLTGDRFELPKPEPVAIGDRVQLGKKVILLPGVTIGAGTTILDDSVISRSLPENVVVQGFPARRVKPTEQSRA